MRLDGIYLREGLMARAFLILFLLTEWTSTPGAAFPCPQDVPGESSSGEQRFIVPLALKYRREALQQIELPSLDLTVLNSEFVSPVLPAFSWIEEGVIQPH